MSQPFFSVVIPTYNRKDSLVKCLNSLEMQTLSPTEFEVIVVDDGSTDGTSQSVAMAKYPFRLRYVGQENAGPSRARNKGVAVTEGRIIALTEDDIIVQADWLANARKYFIESDIDILEGRTVYADSDEDVRRFEPEQRMSFIPCNLFVKKDVYDRLGGYDERFYDQQSHVYFREDADFGFRALGRGCQVLIARDVVVEHPVQFSDLRSCMRHIRRYYFDPLLYSRHASLFRQMIEVKTIAGITIHRPQHYVALLYVVMVCWAIVSSLSSSLGSPFWGIAGAFLCGMLFRFKYQGRKALGMHEVRETFGFVFLPALYLITVIRGCFRFRSFGALL
jgi:glycosyltransferase involved in cell wall biosynthesis